MKKLIGFLLIVCMAVNFAGCGKVEYINTLENYIPIKFGWDTKISSLQKQLPEFTHLEDPNAAPNIYDTEITDPENILCRALKDTESQPMVAVWENEDKKGINKVVVCAESDSGELTKELADKLIEDATVLYGSPVSNEQNSDSEWSTSYKVTYYADHANVTIYFNALNYVELTEEDKKLFEYNPEGLQEYQKMIDEHNEKVGYGFIEIEYVKPE